LLILVHAETPPHGFPSTDAHEIRRGEITKQAERNVAPRGVRDAAWSTQEKKAS